MALSRQHEKDLKKLILEKYSGSFQCLETTAHFHHPTIQVNVLQLLKNASN